MNAARSRPSRSAAALLLAGMATAPACDRTTAHEITIVDGTTTTRFAVKSAFVEYVALAGQRSELRLTLASYGLSCERWVPPRDDEVVVTVVVVFPPDTPPSAASIGWTGIPAAGEPLHAPYALPKAQIGRGSRLFEPGGRITLAHLTLEPHGKASGTLAFEFPGTADRPATRIDGGFEAQMCRYAP